MSDDKKAVDKERMKRVFEVRRTVMVEKEESSTKFVYELHGDTWKLHLAANADFTAEELQDAIDQLKELDAERKD